MAELMDELDGSLIRLPPSLFNDFVDQVILAVPEPAHRFGLRGVIWGALREVDATGGEKVPHAVEAGLPIHIEPVIRGDLERTKWCTGVRRALLQVGIKHLFPTRRVYVGGVRDHAVEVEEDGVVLVAGYGAPHCSPPLGYLRFGCRNDGLGGKAEFALQFSERRRRPKGLHADGAAGAADIARPTQ